MSLEAAIKRGIDGTGINQRHAAHAALDQVLARMDVLRRRIDAHGSHNPGSVCVECGEERPWKTAMRDEIDRLEGAK